MTNTKIWTEKNLSSLCDAAARKDITTIRCHLLSQSENEETVCRASGKSPNKKNRQHGTKHGGHSSYSSRSPNPTQSHIGKKAVCKDKWVNPKETPLAALQLFEQIFKKSTRLEMDDQCHKFQLSMCFRSLLLLPTHHAIPWTAIQSMTKLLFETDRDRDRLRKGEHIYFIDYMIHDAKFAFGIMGDLAAFLSLFHEEVEVATLTQSFQFFDFINHGNIQESIHDRIKDSIIAIEKVCYDILSITLDAVYIQNNFYKSSPEKSLDQKLLAEFIVLLIETGKSIDTFQQNNTKRTTKITNVSVMGNMIDLLIPTDSHETKRIHQHMILPLITVVHHVASDLTHRHWQNLHIIVTYNLQLTYDSPWKERVITPNYPQLFQAIIKIIVLPKSLSNIKDNHGLLPSWVGTIVELYCNIRSNSDLLSSIEENLDSMVKNLPKCSNDLLVEEIIKLSHDYEEDIKYSSELKSLRIGACLNLLFIITHAYQRSSVDTISSILLQTYHGEKKKNNDYMTSYFKFLPCIMPLDNDAYMIGKHYNFVSKIQQFFNNVYYGDDGLIKQIDSSRDLHEVFLSNFQRFMKLMFYSISFYNVHNTKESMEFMDKISATKHIQRYIDIAKSFRFSDANDVLISVAMTLSLFQQIPSIRTHLVQCFIKTFTTFVSSSAKYVDPRIIVCWSIICIINSNLRGDIELKNMSQTFHPFVELLKSEKNQNNLPIDIISQLVQPLSFVASTRVVLYREIPDRNFRPNTSLNVDILSALIAKNPHTSNSSDKCTLDKIGVEALVHILSLIMNRELLSTRNRHRLFTKLLFMVDNHHVTIWVAERIMTASLRTLSLQLRPIASQPSNFAVVDDNNTYDVDETTYLIQIVLSYLQFDHDHLFSSSDIYILVPMKHTPKNAVNDNNQKESITTRYFSLLFIRVIVKHLAGNIPTSNTYQNTLIDEEIYKWENHIYFAEHETIQSLLQDRQIKDFRFLCDSLEYSKSIAEEPFVLPYINFVHNYIYDLIIKMLLDGANATNCIDEWNIHQRSFDRFVCLLKLIGALQDSKKLDLESRSQILLSANGVNTQNIINFLRHISKAIAWSTNITDNNIKIIDQVKSLINSLKVFCDSLIPIWKNDNFEGFNQEELVHNNECIRAMWAFYSSCCSEIACCNLVDLIEDKSLVEPHDDGKNISDKYQCDSSIQKAPFVSIEEIYEYMRQYRFSFVSSFATLLQFHVKNRLWGKHNEENFFLLYIDIACCIIQDMKSGLNAISGGITQSLYRRYLQIVTDVVQAALEISLQLSSTNALQSYTGISTDILYNLKLDCTTATDTLFDIICITEMKSLTICKHSFSICLMQLPLLHIRLDRIAHMSSTYYEHKDKNLTYDKSPTLKAFTILKSCLHHLEQLNKSSNKNRTKECYVERIFNLLLTDSKLFDWTFEFCLNVVERFWTEIQQHHNEKRIENHDTYFPAVCEGFDFKSCATVRTSLVRESLSTILPLFSKDLLYNRNEKICLKCIERIFLSLKASLKYLLKFINEFDYSAATEIDTRTQFYYVESISSVVGFLLEPNLTTTIIQCYPKKTSKRIPDSSNSRNIRLTKTLHNKIQEMEKVLSQFYQCLNKSKHISFNVDSLTQQISHNLTMTQLIERYINKFALGTMSSSGLCNPMVTASNDASARRKRLKESRRDMKKSKNPLVNEWMELDDDLDEDHNGNDNFGDLVDFILPG
jgi:hypothetical protein